MPISTTARATLHAIRRLNTSWEPGAHRRLNLLAVQQLLDLKLVRYDRRTATYLELTPAGRAALDTQEVVA